MVAGVAPFAIFFGLSACIGLGLFAFNERIARKLGTFSSTFRSRIDLADVPLKPEEVMFTMVGGAAMLWLGITLLLHPPILIGLAILPVAVAVAWFAANVWLGWKAKRRVSDFTQQLEPVLRMMSGALRVGLGLRQAIVLVTEEIVDPARREFMRVIGRTNIGISIYDALDELAATVPSQELTMIVKAIRVQSQTGGDLAKVLETLANTIKERRRIHRKMRALTAQGRASAWIIGSMPVLLGGFVIGTQPEMGHALTSTLYGHIALGLAVTLESLAIFALSKILKFNI